MFDWCFIIDLDVFCPVLGTALAKTSPSSFCWIGSGCQALPFLQAFGSLVSILSPFNFQSIPLVVKDLCF